MNQNELKAVRDAADQIKKFCDSMEICNDCFFWELCRGHLEEYDDSLANVMTDLMTSINVELETLAGGNSE